MSLCQHVKRGARASRICDRKGSRWQIRDSRGTGLRQLVNKKCFCLTSCTRKEHPMRRKRQGASATTPFRLSLCFFTGRCSPASIRKTNGKKHAKTSPFGSFSPGMGSKIRRHADKIAALCGEKKCLLRQAARALAENKRCFCGILVKIRKKKHEIIHKNSF